MSSKSFRSKSKAALNHSNDEKKKRGTRFFFGIFVFFFYCVDTQSKNTLTQLEEEKKETMPITESRNRTEASLSVEETDEHVVNRFINRFELNDRRSASTKRGIRTRVAVDGSWLKRDIGKFFVSGVDDLEKILASELFDNESDFLLFNCASNGTEQLANISCFRVSKSTSEERQETKDISTKKN
jgi:hypothetical protein